MGRKVNPIGFRLKINRDWEARWFAEGNRYTELLQEDFKIRQYIYKGEYLNARDDQPNRRRRGGNQGEQEARPGGDRRERRDKPNAALSRIDIDRYPNLVTVTIHTAKPGILIGQKGNTVKKLRLDLEAMTGKKVKVEVEEISKPDLDAKLVADNIVGQLERRISHSRAMKRAIQQAMRQGAQGVKIQVSGRLGGSEMSRREWQMEGRVPRSTLRSVIDYAASEALTTYGRLGVKVWVYTGQKAQEDIPELTADAYVSQ
jgi:small subunit ribosomal protein S3